MKSLFLMLLFTASTFVQGQTPAVGVACGPKGVNFAVKANNYGRPMVQPEPGKALIYFIQITGAASCFPARCVTKIGLDGTWVGAFKSNAYFSVSVDPGEHHACIKIQSHTPLGEMAAFAHVTAKAGGVYYLGTQAFMKERRLSIDPIDSDQAQHMIASLPLSVSHPKK